MERGSVIARLTTFLWISLGAVLGANVRYAVSRLCAQWLGSGFPYGTLAVNVAGSFAAGLAGGLVAAGLVSRPEIVQRLFIVGFLGSLTTFSSLMYETNSLVGDGAWTRAVLNVVLSLVAGLGGVRLGIDLAARMGGMA